MILSTKKNTLQTAYLGNFKTGQHIFLVKKNLENHIGRHYQQPRGAVFKYKGYIISEFVLTIIYIFNILPQESFFFVQVSDWNWFQYLHSGRLLKQGRIAAMQMQSAVDLFDFFHRMVLSFYETLHLVYGHPQMI